MTTNKKTPAGAGTPNEGTSRNQISDTTILAQRRWGTNGENIPKWVHKKARDLTYPDGYKRFQLDNGTVRLQSTPMTVNVKTWDGDKDCNAHLEVTIAQPDTRDIPRITIRRDFKDDGRWESVHVETLFPWEAKDLVNALQTLLDQIEENK